MNDIVNVAPNDASVDKNRERMFERLKQLRANAKSSNREEKRNQELEEDQLIEQARKEAESGIVNSETVRRLEEQLSLQTAGWASKRLQTALEALRKATLARDTGTRKAGFSFVKKSALTSIAPTVTKSAVVPVDIETVDIEEPVPADAENAIVVSDKGGLIQTVTGSDSSSLSLKNLSHCTLTFLFRPSAVHMQNIFCCKLYFLPIDTSILMHNVTNSVIFASAQQIRVHDSSSSSFHVAVRGAVILENCSHISMAPYRVLVNGELQEAAGGDQWRRPSDFDWLAEGQSPNWTILPEEKWTTHLIDS